MRLTKEARERIMEKYKGELAALNKWIAENPETYLGLPDGVQAMLVRGEIETRDRINGKF
jgi:hypothetical protein